MDIEIQKGKIEFLNDCKDALINSELGKRYFEDHKSANEAIKEGLASDTLYVALNRGKCIGFMYYIPEGAFHAFPYLHLIAVKSEYRGQRVGERLIKFLEDKIFIKTSKLFLVVSDFNPKGMRFYKKLGYRTVGEIPNLYREGINEYLMMKEKH